MILRCTKRLLDVLRPARLAAVEPNADDWYANLLWIGRRKCLLLTHARTLFSIFEPDVRAPDLRRTRALVARLIERELVAESLHPETFGRPATDALLLAKTADRRVLGCMNDMALLCEAAVADAGSVSAVDVRSLNRTLHRNINSSRGYERPVDLVVARADDVAAPPSGLVVR